MTGAGRAEEEHVLALDDEAAGCASPKSHLSMRRFTRLTNGFSKKVENLEAAVALHFMWYNFGRVHQTVRVTPAMEAGVADHVWTLAEIVALLG